ncbi:ribosomal protein L35 [Thermobaculum terrenum ATCC BAA-798]|uniref:Large ribosomal subunit protein bL35 n=1 Tax=Thermobaculum terrenum (strain ATCC BAA-798 / CCMEE 7001 / YNP1) TaxID=525904 RepID=D1CFH8_THET1|nr:50S ribosomal protein L35 [Thermobaculum terrenum]ACZ41684.1 ribosomal protein L35 [Thermobaculum terrenum ATCC BAA-798]
MPKLKTNKSAKRRFKITGTGKILRTKGMKSHLRRKKSTRAKQDFDRMFEVSPADRKRLRRALPYGV